MDIKESLLANPDYRFSELLFTYRDKSGMENMQLVKTAEYAEWVTQKIEQGCTLLFCIEIPVLPNSEPKDDYALRILSALATRIEGQLQQ